MEMASEESGLGVLANAKKPTVPFHPIPSHTDTAPCRAECRCRRKKVPDGRVQSVRQDLDAATAACRWRQGQALQSYELWMDHKRVSLSLDLCGGPSIPPTISVSLIAANIQDRERNTPRKLQKQTRN